MRRGWILLPVLLISSVASADMVEIRGEGFFNGTIESEDKDQVVFKDADGKLRTLARKDILFMERQSEPPPAQKVLLKAGQALKVSGPAKKPVSKPAVPAKKKTVPAEKGESFSGGGDAATGALRAMAQAQRAAAASNARVEKALKEAEGDYGSGGGGAVEKKDVRKGRFGSLSAGSDFGDNVKTKKEPS